MRHIRADIQVLRAIAVLSVLMYHFDLPGLKQGFLGVDIFFVISGYLMSGVIIGEMDQSRFQAGRFYLRRARRLLPAAFAMLLMVTAVAPFVLTTGMLRDYAAQLLGAVSFSANIVLWQQSGYFDGVAVLKPLLHTWSLALEEQYYFALPLVLVLAGTRWRAPVLLALMLASLVLCQWGLTQDPSATFYLLPTRAWELMIGSLCALPTMQRLAQPKVDTGWVMLGVMALGLLWGVDAVHPRGDAVLVCLCTAGLILWPSHALQSTRLWMRPLHWIGDRSYSLYLVHWPLIALAKSIWITGVPSPVRVALLLGSLGLAHVLYILVEQPFRHIETAGALAKRLLWIGLPLLIASGLMWQRLHPHDDRDWAHLLRPNQGFGIACEYDTDFTPRDKCADAPQPQTMVWGDSYAMHLIPALQGQASLGGVVQATRSVCTPMLDYARQAPGDPAGRGAQCLAFNKSVLQYLHDTPEIRYVVLSSRWQYYFDDPVVNAQGQLVHPSAVDLARSMQEVVRQLRQLHKKVIVVSPPALWGPGIDLGLCTERHALGLITVMASTHADCSFSLRAAHAQQQQVRAVLSELERRADVPVIQLDAFNCHGDLCATTIDGTPVYRDFGHLSHDGARLLGQKWALPEQIQRLAR